MGLKWDSTKARLRLKRGSTEARLKLDWGSTEARLRLDWGPTEARLRPDWGSTEAQSRLEWGSIQARMRLEQSSNEACARLAWLARILFPLFSVYAWQIKKSEEEKKSRLPSPEFWPVSVAALTASMSAWALEIDTISVYRALLFFFFMHSRSKRGEGEKLVRQRYKRSKWTPWVVKGL